MASRSETAPRFPAVLDGLEFVRRIGSGSSGTVYHASLNGKSVAIKLFRTGARVDLPIVARFRRHDSDALRHPNLAPVLAVGALAPGDLPFDAGEMTDGTSGFCVMPLLAGDPLDVLLEDLERGRSQRPSLASLAVGPRGELHRLFPRRAARVFAEVAEGLSLAHRAGIAHGRLHPRNLIFSPTGRLVITDFGISAPAAATAPSTRAACLAPEELSGATWPQGTAAVAADVYALGQLLQQVLARSPAPRPNGASGEVAPEAGPRVPGSLESCVLKATAPEPGERYQSASEFAADLRRFLNHEKPVAFLAHRAGRGGDDQRGAVPKPGSAPDPAAPEEPRRQRLPGRPREHAAREAQLETELRYQERALERATQLLAGERADSERLRSELEIGRWRRMEQAREHAAREAEAAARLRRSGRLAGAVLLCFLITVAALFTWARRERQQRQQTAHRAAAVAALVGKGELALALERVQTAERSGDAATGVLDALVRNASARDALVSAVEAAAESRLTAAATAVRAAASQGDDDGRLERLGAQLEVAAARDPVKVALLERSSERDVLAALRTLELDIAAGERPPADALLALRAVPAAPARVFTLALRVAALAGESLPVLATLGILEDAAAVSLDGQQFAALHEALETIGDLPARALLCSWTLEDYSALDEASTPAQVTLEPNILVRIDRNLPPGGFTKRWIDWLASEDESEFLRAAPHLVTTPPLAAAVIARLLASESEAARDALATLAASRADLTAALFLEALERAGDFEALLDIATAEHSLALRCAALEHIERDLYPLCLTELRRLALTDPAPAVRRAAFRALSKSAEPAAVGAISPAVNDAALCDASLEWLLRLPANRCADEALSLLEHPQGRVRRAAVTVLRRVDDARLIVPLMARLITPGPGIRAAARSLIEHRSELFGSDGRPAPLGASVDRLLRSLAYPFTTQGLFLWRERLTAFGASLSRAVTDAINTYRRTRRRPPPPHEFAGHDG